MSEANAYTAEELAKIREQVGWSEGIGKPGIALRLLATIAERDRVIGLLGTAVSKCALVVHQKGEPVGPVLPVPKTWMFVTMLVHPLNLEAAKEALAAIDRDPAAREAVEGAG